MATPSSQIAAELWPQILRRLERWQRNVGAGGGSGGTVTVEFTGTVTDDQAPQFLLRDGSRSLQGDLAVDSGVTIDGIDISAHAADASAHHAPATAGSGIALTGQSVAVDSTVVRTSRTLTAGDGISGGGDLSANRSFAVSLATDPGLEFASGLLRAKIVTGDMTRTASGLGVNRAIVPTWTGVHTFNAQPVIANNLQFSGARSVTSTSTDALTLAPGGELVLDPGSTVTLAAGEEFRSSTFTDAVLAIGGFRLWDKGGNAYQMTLGAIKADELRVKTFVADETRVDRGVEYWSKSYGITTTDSIFTATVPGYGNITVEAPALTTGWLFAVGDWLTGYSIDWSTGITAERYWLKVTAQSSQTSYDQTYAVEIHSGQEELPAGAILIDVGQSGQGWVHLSALSSDGGPFVQVGTWSGSDPYTPANVVNRVRMGHLSGVAGYSAGKWGFAAGNDLALTPTTGLSGITAEATDGVRLHNTQIDLYDGGNLAVRMNQSHGLIFAQEADLAVTSRRALKWYSDPTTPSGPKGLISSYTSTGPLGGDFMYLTPASSVYHAFINLSANSSDASLNGVELGGTGGIRAFSKLQARAGIEVYDPDAGPPHTPMAVGAAIDTAAQLLVASSVSSRSAIVARAAASQTAAIQAWQDSSGSRLAQIDATGGISSNVAGINDDAALTLYTDAYQGMILLWLRATSAGAQVVALIAIRAGASSPHATLLAGGTGVEVTTSDVTGTTGTDGKLTVSATASALKIENRLGGTRTVSWLRIT